MTSPEPKRRYCVGAIKIPTYQRDVAHSVITEEDDSGYRDVMGSNRPDADEQWPVGSLVAYSVELTDAEAALFAAASNARYVELDQEAQPHRCVGRPTGALEIPTLATLGWLRARQVDLRRWHGRDVPVAVLDQGTTAAVRAAMDFTLVARTITSGVGLGPDQELVDPEHDHGCLVAPNAVPAGGMLLDCIISGAGGGASDSSIAAGITWAVDNGAKLINISFGGAPGAAEGQVVIDAATYARDRGVHIVASAGNDDTEDLSMPAGLSRSFANVHSSIAFDEATDRRGLFSNHAADASGCGPGVDVTSLDISGRPVRWNGTSASAPHMCHVLARAMTANPTTGVGFTADQVGAAAKANTRDTGAGASEQGGGAYDLARILTALGAGPSASSGVATPTHVDSRGAAATPAFWALTPAPGITADDLQIAVLVSSAGAGAVVPHGWRMLIDSPYHAGWELSRGQAVTPTRVRVLTAPYVASGPNAQPSSVTLSMAGGGWTSALALITVRGAGGLDPERCAPVVRFGAGASITTLPTLPATSNDLQICVFAQRHPTATTGTLSLPTGLTQRGFWRPSSGTSGYTLLVATTALTSAATTPSYTSTSNDATGTGMALTLTVPGGAPEIAPVTQAEGVGPPGAPALLLPRA